MKTRGVTEGALFCAIAVILSVISFYVPFFTILTFFIPIPMIILGKRQGLKVSILSSVAATILIGIILGPIAVLQYGLMLLLVGCSLGWAYEKDLTSVRKSIVGAVGFAFFMLALIFSYQIITGVNFLGELNGIIKTSAQDAIAIYEGSGLLSSAQLADMQLTVDETLKLFQMSIPAVFLLTPVLLAMVNVTVSDVILKKMGYPVNGFKPLGRWKVPEHLKVFLLLLMLLIFAVTLFRIEMIPEIYLYTVRILVYFVFFIMGIACIFNYLAYKKMKNKGIKVLIIFICTLFPTVITFLGIADTYLDIRRIFRREKEIK